MTKNPLMLYDSKVALEFEGQWLLLDAITEISGDTQITLSGPSRKSLFGYSPEILQARQATSTSVTITSYITKGFPESVFFRMAGFKQILPRRVTITYPEPIGQPQPLGNIYIESSSGSFVLTDCQVEGIDLPFQLDKVGQFTVSLQAKRIDPVDTSIIPVGIKTQGKHMLPGPVESRISGYVQSQIGQSVTFQRQMNQLNNVLNCFNVGQLLGSGSMLLSDSNLGASIQEYVTKDRLLMPDSVHADFEISQSGLIVKQADGIATKRLQLQQVHSLYWDFKAHDTIEIIGPKED